jgi:hypothetical protein
MPDDPREQISEIEAQIEELVGALERCRKTALASKAAMALGGLLLAATILGIITFDPMAMAAAVGARGWGGGGFWGGKSSRRRGIEPARDHHRQAFPFGRGESHGGLPAGTGAPAAPAEMTPAGLRQTLASQGCCSRGRPAGR